MLVPLIVGCGKSGAYPQRCETRIGNTTLRSLPSATAGWVDDAPDATRLQVLGTTGGYTVARRDEPGAPIGYVDTREIRCDAGQARMRADTLSDVVPFPRYCQVVGRAVTLTAVIDVTTGKPQDDASLAPEEHVKVLGFAATDGDSRIVASPAPYGSKVGTVRSSDVSCQPSRGR